MKNTKKLLLALLSTVIIGGALTGCGNSSKTDDSASNSEDKKIIKIGATSQPHVPILESIKDELAKDGYELDIKEFSDYNLLNQGVNDKDLDANFFQHQSYLDNENSEKGFDLTSIAKVHIEPIGAYSSKIENIDDIKDGGIIAIPNDPTNGARALELLEKEGLIELKDTNLPTINDISKNPKNLEFNEAGGEQLTSLLPDVDIAVVNTNYALEGDLNPTKDAIAMEASDSPYANIVVVNSEDKDTPWAKALAKAINSDTCKKYLESLSSSGIIPAF